MSFAEEVRFVDKCIKPRIFNYIFAIFPGKIEFRLPFKAVYEYIFVKERNPVMNSGACYIYDQPYLRLRIQILISIIPSSCHRRLSHWHNYRKEKCVGVGSVINNTD